MTTTESHMFRNSANISHKSHIISSVIELHLAMGKEFAEISMRLAVVYLIGGGGGLNGGGRSILQREKVRSQILT